MGRTSISVALFVLTACSGGPGVNGPDGGASPDAGTGVDGGGTRPDAGSAGADASYLFPSTAVFYQDISSAALDPHSAVVLAHLADAGGWGTPGTAQMQIDFSLAVQYADNTVATRAFTPGPSYPTPDCDTTPVPVPQNGWIGGVLNYQCNVASNDCLLLVVQGTRLYELFGTTIAGGHFDGSPFTSQCETAWDLTRDYWQPSATYARGDQCQSADPSGLPIIPLLATGDELSAGLVPHALRFRLPQDRIRGDAFAHPATHPGTTAGDPLLPAYGARFRLRSSFPVNTLTPGGATVAVALQKYGMFLSSAGNVPLTMDQSAGGFVSAGDLSTLQVSDFEIVASPDPLVTTAGTCQRTPLTQ